MTRKGGHRVCRRVLPCSFPEQLHGFNAGRRGRLPSQHATYPISFRSDLNRCRKMVLWAYIARYFEWNGACEIGECLSCLPMTVNWKGRKKSNEGKCCKTVCGYRNSHC